MAKKRSTILSGLKETAGNTPQRGSDIEKAKASADREEILNNLRTAAAGGDLGGSRINEAYAEYRQKKEQARADRYQSLVRDTQSLFDENGRLNSGVTLHQLAQLSRRTQEAYKERTDSNAEYLRSLDNYLKRLAGGQVAYGMTSRLLPEEQRDALRNQIAGITVKKTQTPQERMAQDEAAEREASGYVSPENYAASIRANKRAADRIRSGGVIMSDGRYHVGKGEQEELDRLAQSTARSELAMRAQEDETAMFRGSDYWLRRANELERKRKASRSGYGGMMQGGTAFREVPEFTEQDRQDWDKAREYYYQVKNAERWGSMPEDLRQKALEAAGYTTDSVLAWQDGDEAALAGMTPDQRAQRQRDQRARRDQIAAILAGAGYEPEAVIEYAARVRNAERMQQEMSGLAGDVTGRGAEGVARGVYGTVQSYATNLLSPIGSVGLLAQKLFRGGAGAEQYRPVDYNTPSMYFSQGTSTIRGAVGGQMGDVGRFFYDTANSFVDSGVRMLVGQALGGGGIKPSPDMTEEAAAKLNRFVSGFISAQMSGEVFANSFVQAKESGSTDADALLDSVTAALIEGLTEKYSVEAILKNPNGLAWTALRNNFLAEGSEEMASDFLNTIYDELKNGDDSELRTQYRELLASGATENDAFNRVFGDYVKQVVLDGLAGGLSGIAMGGVAEYMTNKRYEAAYADPADTQALLDEARAVNPDSKLLKRAEQRVAEGKGITGYQARELMGRNEKKLAPLKQASAKYGKQSGAMQATYQEGQDVAQYDMSYRVAYEMGKAGARFSAAQTSEATDYLTDAQKQAAWSAGRDARTRLSDVSEVANGRALLNGQIAEVQTVSAQDGKLMAEVRQGESVQTVALDSLKVDAGTRTLAEGAKQYGSAAGTVFEQYKAGQDVAAYLRAADMAAAVGMASPSASSETVLRNLQAGQLGKALSGEQITAIYKAGQTAGRAQLRKTGMTRLGTGTVTFEQSAKGAKLNARQKAAVQFIRDMAKITGIDFTIYKSSADSTGRLQGANGAYRDGTVHVDLNAGAAYEGKLESASMLRTVSHELTHYMAEMAPTEFSALQDFMVQRLSQWEGHSIQDLVEGKMATAEQAGHPITAQEALEEVVADGCEMMLRDSKAIRQLAEENRTLFEKVRDWMTRFFDALRKAFEGVEAVHPESIHMMENYAEELQRLWDDALTAAVKNAKEGTLGTAHADLKAADTLMNPTQEAAFSLRDNEKFQENAEKKNEALGLVPVNVMRSAAEARSQIAEIMRDPKLRDALNLPDDFSGKTYFPDGAYNGTEENTTVCPRSMGADELLDAVSELLGRPLTVDECINISQFMAGTELRPECEYCYVATDRKAYREFLGKYIEQRDEVVRRMEGGMSDADNYKEFLGERKDTKNMRSRFDLWVKTARSGGQMMQASDLANVNKLMHDIIEPGIRAQVKDAMRYAQSASWAKKRIGYTAYNGHILNWTKDKITKLNKGFGLRMYSFSDFSPAFILENMQMITDASVRGLKMLAYTKDLDFVRIFAPSGININVSVFGFERNGVVAENALQGASWAEAQKLRAENPNVGITFVATNDTLVNWALAQDWIDVVIPYHLVRTGKQVAQRLGFTNYTAESSDVKQAGWTKGNAKEILPTQHNNDLQTYLRALEENNLRPRFERFLDNPNYMKLVNETRRSALETPAVQPVFDVEAAKKSLIGMIKDGGYFQHIGGSVDRMYEIASDLSQKIYEGVKFSDRAPLTTEQAEAEKRFGTTMDFNEAGFILPDGKMLRFTDDANAGARNYDHRAIGMVYGVDVNLAKNHGFNMESNRHMNRFVEDGGIRFDPGDPDYDMGAGMQLSKSKALTKAQERTIRDFIAWKQERDAAYVPPDEFAEYMGAQGPLPLTIEFGGGADIAVGARSRDLAAWNVQHLTYEGGQINADRVIADIRHYYETGEVRKPSEVARFRYSERVTDKKTLDFLNRQKTVKTYKTMQLVDGKLYPPMAARTNGQYEDYSVLGQWEQATEHPELVRDGKYKLDKGKGQGSLTAAYNPYMHSSNLVLNDQFSGAYARPNLVTVECEVPVSELTSGYRADGAKDAVGWHAWHTGTVAGQLRAKTGTERQVLLSRWIKPVRILPDAEVAQMYKRLLSGTDIAVPDNVVTPSLLRELRKAGVSIKESGRVTARNAQGEPRVQYSDRDNRAQKSIKDQIRANAAALSEMKSVANIRADLRGMNIKEKRQWAENVLKASGYRVERQAFGVIAFEPRHINEGLNYLSDDGEIAAFAALPQLLKRGKIIDVHNNHKGRDFGTVTIAAPVEINGVRGNMATVVKRTGKDHYHTHRILMPDGSAFEFLVQENTEPKPAGALSESDTHATPMDPVSGNRIAQNDPTVKRQERDITITPAEILDEINLDAVKGTAAYDALRDYKNALAEREDIRQKLEAQQDLAQNIPAGERVKAKNRADIYQKQFDRADTKVKQLRRNTALRQFVESEMAYVNGRQDALNQADAAQGRYTERFEQRLEEAYQINRTVQERYASMAQQYGTIPVGETPARTVAVPKRTEKGNRVSQTVRTAMEARATTEAGVRALKKAVVEGNFSYLPITDKAAGSKATETIKDKGYQKALADWTVSMSKGHPGKDAVALGFQLYNQAVNSGDTKTAVQVLTDLASRVREGAQMVQAVRMLKKLSPDNQLYSVQLSLKALQEDVDGRYGKKAPKLKLNEALVNNFLEAENEAQKEAAQKAIYRDIASQLPHTFMDRWNSWRYLCMLGNARTHVRNILGNAGFVPVRRMKDAVALGIEAAYSKAKGGNVERSKGFVSPNSDLYKLAKADYENIADLITGGGKYNDAASGIERMKSAFGEKGVWKYLSKIADANSFALDAEDVWFSKPAYAQSLAGYLKANKITAEQFNADEAIRDKARAYAVKEAQRATYRDYNDFSNFIAKVGRTKRGGGTTAKVASTLMEGVLPFRRTPANILVRGVEYSPIGLAQGIYQATRGVKTGKYTAAQAIDRISAGLTGTALVALGALLTAHGILTPPDDDDDKQSGFDKLRGAQSYALKIGKTYATVDWLAPEALPVFVGSQLSKLFSGDSEGGLKALYSALTTISEPMLEMSMLSSLQDVIENVSYADSKLMAILSTAATNYLTQAFPTLAGQIERIAESERETTFATEDSALTKDLQYILAKIMNKTPGEFQQIPYIDAWGRHEDTGTVLARAFNNLINPAYLSYDKSEPFEDELQRLYDLGYSDMLPQRVKQSQKVDGETLTQEEYVAFAETKGKTQYEALKGIIESSWYEELSDAARGELLGMAYSYADGMAKLEVNENADVSKWILETKAAVEDGGKLSEILRDRLDEDVIDFQTAYPQYADLGDNKIHGYLEYCEPAGVPLDTVYNAAQTCKDFEGEKDSDGKTISGSVKAQVVDYIQGLGLSRDQEKALWDALKGNWKDTDTPWE